MSSQFRKLTRNLVKSLEPGQSITEHGIEIARTRTGDLRYTVSVMVDGERIHRTLGLESQGVTRHAAEVAIATYRTHAREGRLSLAKGRKTHRTFAEAAKEYLRRMDDSGGKNMKAKRHHLGEHTDATVKKRTKTDGPLLRAFGKLRADRVTTFGVQQYVQDRLKLGTSQATINRELATLSHAFKRMIEWKWIKPEDAPTVTKGNEPRKAIVVLSEESATALMKAAIADQDRRLYLFVAFGLNTAMRHSEILRVKFDQIDYDARRIFISQAKAGEREQPITPALAAMLKTAQDSATEAKGWVFPATRADGKHEHRCSMAKQFLRAVKRAKLQPAKVTPHVMRHTAITRLVRAGVDLPTIQKISGHKTLPMVLRYVHIHGQHIDEAIRALDMPFPAPITPELHTPERGGKIRAVA